MAELRSKEVTERTLHGFYGVYNELGYGFLERVYENSMAHFLRELGLKVVQQHPIQVHFRGVLVGRYSADLLVNNLVIVEIKATRSVIEEHAAQLLNYLKATPFEIGLLLNLGPKPEHIRKVYDNSRKRPSGHG